MKLYRLEDIINNYNGLAHKVLNYSQLIKQKVDEAKQPGFSIESWEPLANLIDTKNFTRVGNFKEEMTWESYLQFLTGWAQTSEWDCSFKRVTEYGSTVFLELEERTIMGGVASTVNSFSVYEFNDQGKIYHVDVYLQMELPSPEMLKSYDGVL